MQYLKLATHVWFHKLRGFLEIYKNDVNRTQKYSITMERSILQYIPPDILDDLTISEQEQILDYFTENDFTQDDVDYLMNQVLFYLRK